MPAHPAPQPRYRNIVQLRISTYAQSLAQSGNPNAFYNGGYQRLAKSRPGTSWKIESIWLSNWSVTDSFKVTVTRVPFDWPGAVDDEHLFILRGLELKPGQYLSVPVSFVLLNGDSLWGYQIESGGGATYGVTMVIAAEEGR